MKQWIFECFCLGKPISDIQPSAHVAESHLFQPDLVGWTRENDLETTSSTAQGGGGSFKNKKHIGEVGCCESRMAVFSGKVAMVAAVTSPQLLDVVWRSAVAVVVVGVVVGVVVVVVGL